MWSQPTTSTELLAGGVEEPCDSAPSAASRLYVASAAPPIKRVPGQRRWGSSPTRISGSECEAGRW
jgi:hypothetical protein